MIGAVLLGVYRREDEVIQMQWKGDGPLGGLLVIGDHTGQVRGKVGNPSCNIPLKDNGKFDVGGAVGQGMLSVIRSHPLEPNPYTGTVPIFDGEIAEDLARYMLDSEQMACALALGVQLNVSDGRVHSAGGYFVQVLPFCSEETLEKLEANLKSMGSASHLLAEGNTPADITQMILKDIGVADEEPVVVTPKYGPCDEISMRLRMLKALAALGKEEVDDILNTDGKIEVKCDLCNSTVEFTEANKNEIFRLADEIGDVNFVYE